MTKLRTLARGRECQVRLLCCNRNTETVVLAHYRLPGTCGIGIKPPDLLGAWCCSSCHDVVDGRVALNGHSREEVLLDFAEGVLRTIAELIKLGAIK